jgi:two-component system, LytTR family, sensor kinase
LKSELSFLRSQISPHFIFNVLNSIISLSRRKPERVEPVVVKLSELMRYMLYESDDAKVIIEREVEYLRAYIDLQQLRFGDDVDIKFTSKILDQSQTIEPMLLIPFVENAFKHGVGMIQNPTIEINLQTENKRLVFEVKNKVNRQSKEVKDSASGIGLNNVKRRLELLYPENHQLMIKDEGDFYVIHLDIG